MTRAIWISLAVLSSVICVRSQNTPPSNPDISRGRAALVRLSKPIYPQMARVANIFGEVKVSVTVHPDDTTDVVGLSGHPLLRSTAIDSAKQSQFTCRAC
ncbi:MAG TPA: energy transducer TonB, partial [Terriglobales bacterium]